MLDADEVREVVLPVVVAGVLTNDEVGRPKNADVVGNSSGTVRLSISQIKNVNLHGHLSHIQ